ncbi:glycosyltransferase [Bacteroidota bacterium]
MNKRFKVLFITAWYPTKGSPVGGTFVREHAKAVRQYDDIVLLHVVGNDLMIKNWWKIEKESDEKLIEGISTYRLWYRRRSNSHISYFIYIWSVFRAFRYIIRKEFRPDIIHAHIYETAVPAVIIGRLYNIPVIVTEHYSVFPRKLLQGFDRLKAKIAFKFAKLVIPVSQFLQQAIESYGIKAQFTVIPNAVNTKIFFPSKETKQVGDLIRLLTVSSFDKTNIKGLPYLFNALSMLQKQREDWHLEIIGDGITRIEYEGIVNDSRLREKVTFHGYKNKEEVAKFMRQSDIFVISSLFETFSVATAEALTTGLPILATRCGGPEGFVNENVGLLIPPRDAEALRNGLSYMMANLKNFSTDYISKYSASLFSFEHVGKRFHDIYLDCMKNN